MEANIKAQQDNYSAARTAYEAAIELNPHSAPLRYWFAGFLLRYQNELEEALKEFKEAAKLDPNSIDIQMEMARACLFLRRFNEAKPIIDHLLNQPQPLKAVVRRKIYDLHIQYFVRKADYLIYQRDKQSAFEELEHLRSAYQKCPPALLDGKMKERLKKVGNLIRACSNILQNEEDRGRADKLLEWFENEIQNNRSSEVTWDIAKRLDGKVIRLVSGRNFGFILASNDQEFFFRRFTMSRSSDWGKLEAGSLVFFWNGGFIDGPNPTAVNVIVRDADENL